VTNGVLIVNQKHGEPKDVDQIGTRSQRYSSVGGTVIVYGDVDREWLFSSVVRAPAIIVFLTEDGKLLGLENMEL